MVCVDPYLNATTRHAHVILPPPSVLEKSHYDLAFTALSVRDVAHFSPPVFEREPGRAVGVRDPRPARRDRRRARGGRRPDAIADATLAARIAEAVDDPESPIHGRDAGRDRGRARRPAGRGAAARSHASHRPPRRRASAPRPDGLSLDVLEHHPHGIDFGPLGRGFPMHWRRNPARSSSRRRR